MSSPTKETAELRCALAVIMVRELRMAIDCNGGKYTGALVPNLTSISDLMLLSDVELEKQLDAIGARGLLPASDEIARMVLGWEYK